MSSVRLMKAFWQSLVNRTKSSEYAFIVLGYMFFFGYAGWYLIWHNVSIQSYENLPLRIVGSLLGIPLILKNYWPKKICFLMPLYWYVTLLYTLPFFFTFMLLKNNGAVAWQLSGATALVLFILVVDWFSVSVLTLMGVSLGCVAYVISTPIPQLPMHFTEIITNYAAILLFCGFFLYKKEQIAKEKLLAMKFLAGTMAHELKTPLRTIGLIANQLKRYLSILLDTFKLAKQKNIQTAEISESNLEDLKNIPQDLDFETNAIFTFINLLWGNVNQPKVSKEQLKKISISHCVSEMLHRYPLTEQEKNIIHFNAENNFEFMGDESLMIHILFNLLKNALYHIHGSKNLQIQIWCDQNERYNQLHFKDMGCGISKQALRHVFEPFYSQTLHGTGIGLAFCKNAMTQFGGEITCRSEEEQYTEFILSFQRITKP